MSIELQKRDITARKLFGKLSSDPTERELQLNHAQVTRAKLELYKHWVRCLDCLEADASCDQCPVGEKLSEKLEKCL